MKKKIIYADNAATTPVSKAAFSAMLPYFRESFGNPSAIYCYGLEAKQAVEEARRTIANAIGARNNEIFFTSGGTESDNWAIIAAAEARKSRGRHIITTGIEHSAVYYSMLRLEDQGYEVTYLPVDKYGHPDPCKLEKVIRDDTILISIMMANNEVGTILDIKELAGLARRRKIPFHTDAVQAVGHIPVNVSELGVDMLSISAHKFGGPKGIGALYVRLGNSIPPMISGGGQEKGRRSGTLNVPGIVGMAAAVCDSVDDLMENMEKTTRLRDRLIDEVLKLPYARLTGDPVKRLPGLASFVFEGFEGMTSEGAPIVSRLSEEGVCASSGSACSAGSGEPSRILKAAGYPDELIKSSLRLSLSERNTDADVEYITEKLRVVLEKLRSEQK